MESRALYNAYEKGRVMKKLIGSLMLSSMALSTSWACGPYRCESYFFNQLGSYSNYSIDGFELDFPIKLIKNDQLGIIVPNMSILYLWASYRLWSDKPLSKKEQELLEQAVQKLTQNAAMIENALEGNFYNPEAAVAYSEPAQYQWTDAVKRVLTQENPSLYFSTSRSLQKESNGLVSYFYFENCQDDAFKTALSKLQVLIGKYGIEHPAVIRWTQNQQRVFMNCGGDKPLQLPDPLPGDSMQDEKQDYDYQVASSYFYAMDYQRSSALYDTIAGNNESPHQTLSAYLVLRSHYRNTQFFQADPKMFFDAVKQHQTLLKNSIYASDTNNLVQRMKHLVNPDTLFSQISSVLEAKSGVVTDQTLKDLVYLYKTEEKNFKGPDFLDWIQLFRAKGKYTESYNKWKKSSSLPWLIACLQNLSLEQEIPTDLKKQAYAVNSSSPAYLTVQYLLIKHALQKHPDEARVLIKKTLENDFLPTSARNRLKSLQIKIALTFEIFIDSILQTPLMDVCYNKANVDLDFSDDHAVYMRQLNRRHLESLLENKNLPEWMKKQVALVLFARAILSGRIESAEKYLDAAAYLLPEVKEFSLQFKSLKTHKEKEMLGHLMILRSPGLSIFINPATWRDKLESIQELDRSSGLGENWWDNADLKTDFTILPFLSNEEANESKDEWTTLQSTFKEGLVDYFSKKAIEWFKTNPKNPYLPEMLHLCVRMSRFKQPAPESSYKAFKLLHEYFKDSEYAIKTPYHYYTKQ